MSLLFNNKLQEPNHEMLIIALDDKFKLLEELCLFIEKEFGDFHSEWKYYGVKIGWQLKLFHKKRNVVFITIESGYFRLSFAIGGKAYNEILNSTVPNFIKQQLTEAKVYVEGRPLRLEIRTKEDIQPIKEIVRIKLMF